MRYFTAAFLLVIAACDQPGPRRSAAREAASGIFLAEVGTGRHELAGVLTRTPGVWGVQEIPPNHVIFRAPAPLAPDLRALLSGAQLYTGTTGRRDLPYVIYDQLLAPPLAAPPAIASRHGSDALVADEAAPIGKSPRFTTESYSRVLPTYRTSEVFVGSTAIVLLLPESNGTLESSTENWTAADVSAAVAQVSLGLAHAQSACKSCRISFVLHLVAQNSAPGAVYGTVDADYEPINHAFNDLTVNQNLLAKLGYAQMNTTAGFRQLANDIRTQYGTDWAVVIKVGLDKAANGRAWGNTGLAGVAYLGGPFLAVTFMNAPLGGDALGDLWRTVAHELNHSFYATDEYLSAGVSPSSVAGYFKVANAGSAADDETGFNGGAGEGEATCIMAYSAGSPSSQYCAHTQGQVGWWDDDADGIPDVIDAPPQVTLTAACGAQVGATGEAYVNQHYLYELFPTYHGNPHVVGLGRISRVEYRLNRLTWLQATAQDGAFDQPREMYALSFAVPNGSYALEVRAVDAEGNTVPVGERASCVVSSSSVTNAAPQAAFDAMPRTQSVDHLVHFDASPSTDLEDAPWHLEYRWDFNSDGADDGVWGADRLASHAYAAAGTYAVRLTVRDTNGAARAVTQSVTIATADLAPVVRFTADRQVAGGTSSPVFQFSAAASIDPEGLPLTARWDFDGDGTWDTQPAPTLVTSYTYLIQGGSGAWSPAVEVSDARDNVSVAYLNLRAVAYDQAPTAAFSIAQQSATRFLFNAAASSDPDLSTLWDGFMEYRWDFDGDGSFDTPYATSATAGHTFIGPGSFFPTVEVRDRFRLRARLVKSIPLVGGIPTGLTADGGASRLQPSLAWTAVAAAAGYEVQIGRALQTPEFTWRATGTTTVAPPLLSGEVYWWRVTGLTAWSEPLGYSAAVSYIASTLVPWVTDVKLSPAAPRKSDGILLSYRFHGVGRAESGTETLWFRNGIEQSALRNVKFLAPKILTKHDAWAATIRPRDGIAQGEAVSSGVATVNNSPPSLTTARLVWDAGAFTCIPEGWADADDDAPGYTYAWYLGERLQAGDSRLVTEAPSVRCEISPFDGEEAGLPVTSTTAAPTDGRIRAERKSNSGCGCQSAPTLGDGVLLALFAMWWGGRLRSRQPRISIACD